MNTNKKQLNISQVLEEAIRLIEITADNNYGVEAEAITRFYNAECDEQERVEPEEFSLAHTVAIGAITQQDGSNVQSLAAMDNLAYLLGKFSS